MSAETHSAMEFHLDRALPKLAGWVLFLSGVSWMYLSIAIDGISFLVFIVGLAFLLVSNMCFTLKIFIRIDKGAGRITSSAGTRFHTIEKSHSIADFTGVGIGTFGTGGQNGNLVTRTRYFVQLLGQSNLYIPVISSDASTIRSLAEKVGNHLNLPVHKKPQKVSFKRGKIVPC